MKRPDTTFGPVGGLLHAEQFQVAYATNDMERARRLFSERFGITAFSRLEGKLPAKRIPPNEITRTDDNGRLDLHFSQFGDLVRQVKGFFVGTGLGLPGAAGALWVRC